MNFKIFALQSPLLIVSPLFLSTHKTTDKKQHTSINKQQTTNTQHTFQQVAYLGAAMVTDSIDLFTCSPTGLHVLHRFTFVQHWQNYTATNAQTDVSR